MISLSAWLAAVSSNVFLVVAKYVFQTVLPFTFFPSGSGVPEAVFRTDRRLASRREPMRDLGGA